ncbi:hypothetical protein BGZ99_007519 [Dissophora globulifera]|uniref:Thioredoxin domain-containing protein n=1 Tax=Dissophora globulifera TaxID=979702 RepID=A0A9P6R9L6_9FUNG|nr:hypothetical protein BGZ99_007519 [Dissophora globulifera]
MTSNVSYLIVNCKTQEELDEIIARNNKVVVLYCSYAMPLGKAAENKIHACAQAVENGNITNIPFVLVNYAEFYKEGSKVNVEPTLQLECSSYVDGVKNLSTSNSEEFEGLVTGLL